ncbi:MAG: S-methyl-5-thioribose-1-phosphate isomerase [Oscillospiraceae bacterium]|nr:S-methyl-5-thioribose-1-phosphate isomerase [Oscillospiraceae bacterium]
MKRERSIMQTIDHVRLNADETKLVILDQTQLPNRMEYAELTTAEEMYDAIKKLRVRGAPCIGIFAGFAMYVLAKGMSGVPQEEFERRFSEYSAYLNASRPTAVNLSWALRRMERAAAQNRNVERGELLRQLRAEAQAILDEDIAMCRAISENGLSLLREGDCVLTHCNAGPIATSRYGTAIGPLILGTERGMKLKAFSDETRPLLQGARLTSWELDRAGVDVTLICDNMASMVMKNGWVQFCFVGCDRVAANGDAANKIGTSGLAILAKHYGVPFYVLGPTSTIDMACPTGDDIQIELRDPDEIKKLWYREPMAPESVKCFNPAFDVTDHSLIDGIITEKGICRAPYTQSLAALFQ